jgi:hypothetical protein
MASLRAGLTMQPRTDNGSHEEVSVAGIPSAVRGKPRPAYCILVFDELMTALLDDHDCATKLGSRWFCISWLQASPLASPPASTHRLQSHVFVIAVAGGTASGKTTVCNLIMQRLHDQVVAMLPQDAFYKALTPEQHEAANLGSASLLNIGIVLL